MLNFSRFYNYILYNLHTIYIYIYAYYINIYITIDIYCLYILYKIHIL